MAAILYRPQFPDQEVYQAPTHFREKGGIFSMGVANSQNQEKWVILQAWVREILKKSNACSCRFNCH